MDTTLRGALAGALNRHTYSGPSGNEWTEADAILADPHFRAELTKAVAEALDVLNLAEGRGEAPETAARIIEWVCAR